MLQKKKLCIVAVLCGILFFIIASRTLQRRFPWPVRIQVPYRPYKTPVKTQATAATEPGQRRSCSCQTCIAEAGVSDWFDRRYDRKQHPYLTVDDNLIDRHSLKWWLSLQQSINGTMQEVLGKMFQIISSPRSRAMQQPGQCKKCAVVGNSGNLLNFKFGPEIDSHPIVFRMNKATTSGFEKYVGNKTTHHFMYPESAVDLAPGVHLVLLPFKLKDLEWVTSALSTGKITKTYMKVKERVRADKDKVIVVHPGFFRYTYENWTKKRGRYPSTGMLAIIFALHVCDEVSVFGYGANLQGNWHHYWEDNKFAGAFRKTGVHDADFERDIILKLEAEGKITLHPKTENF